MQSLVADSAPVQALIEALAADGDCSLYMPSPTLHLRQAQRFAHLCCAECSFLQIPRKCFALIYQDEYCMTSLLCQCRPDRTAVQAIKVDGVFTTHQLQY